MKLLVQNIVGAAAGIAAVAFVYFAFYHGQGDNQRLQYANNQSPHTFESFSQSDYFGLASIAARKALDKNTTVELVYNLKPICGQLNRLTLSRLGNDVIFAKKNPIISVDKSDQNNNRHDLIELINGIKTLSDYCIDDSTNKLLLTTSEEVRAELDTLGIAPSRIAIANN